MYIYIFVCMYMCNTMFLVAEREKIFEEKENTESERRATDKMEEYETENEGKEAVLVRI